MGNRQQIDRGVHVSTALQSANQSLAASYDERTMVSDVESSDEAIERAFGGHATRRWETVTSDARYGMLFAPFLG
jgi:hypothetical protein